MSGYKDQDDGGDLVLRKYRATYLPFPHSDVEASDIIVTGKDVDDARQEFERQYPVYSLVSLTEAN